MGTIVRGKILRDDLALWDGKTKTATRVDATSGTVTGNTVGYAVDVLQVFGGTRTRGTIEAALSWVGSSTVPFVFDSGTWSIDDDVTIPSNIACHIVAGCIFDVTAAKTLTFNGPVYVEEPNWLTGSGTVNTNLGAAGFPNY